MTSRKESSAVPQKSAIPHASVAPGESAPDGSALRDLPRRVLDNLLEGCQVIGRDFRYLYANDAVIKQARTKREDLLGKKMTECFPGIEETEMYAALVRCMNEGTAGTLENQFTYPDGLKAWFELRFEPVPEGVVVLSMNITERKRNEEALGRTIRSLSILSRYNQTLVRSSSEKRLIQEVCDLVIESGGYAYARIDLRESTKERPGLRHSLRAPSAEDQVPASADSFVHFDVEAGDEIIGTLTVCSNKPNPFDADEIGFLEEIAEGLGYGIENLRARTTPLNGRSN